MFYSSLLNLMFIKDYAESAFYLSICPALFKKKKYRHKLQGTE